MKQNLATLARHLRGLRILAAILAMLNWRPKGAMPLPLSLCSGVVALEAIGDRILSWTDDSFSITSSASAWCQGFIDYYFAILVFF